VVPRETLMPDEHAVVMIEIIEENPWLYLDELSAELLFRIGVSYKPKKIYKLLSDGYQRRLEERYGENILRHVIRTSDFSFPSEDYTGQLNEIVARKTREMFALHAEMVGREIMDIEEVKITEDLLPLLLLWFLLSGMDFTLFIIFSSSYSSYLNKYVRFLKKTMISSKKLKNRILLLDTHLAYLQCPSATT
jgi:hypothetical protein